MKPHQILTTILIFSQVQLFFALLKIINKMALENIVWGKRGKCSDYCCPFFQQFFLTYKKEITIISVLHIMSFCKYFFNSNPFLNKPLFLCICSTNLLKTQWEKEKLLMMSNFFISHSVFYDFGKLLAIFTIFKTVLCKLF